LAVTLDKMQELRELLKDKIENELATFLQNYGFEFSLSKHEYSETYDVFKFKKDDLYIDIEHYGFHPHDYPWSICPMLGRQGFKRTTSQFDSIPLWYYKQKIAPKESWQREVIKLTFDNYPINSKTQIVNAVSQTIFDLDNFCKDYLTNDLYIFDKIREINYLEYLVQTQVFGEYHWTGKKKFTIYKNKEVE